MRFSEISNSDLRTISLKLCTGLGQYDKVGLDKGIELRLDFQRDIAVQVRSFSDMSTSEKLFWFARYQNSELRSDSMASQMMLHIF